VSKLTSVAGAHHLRAHDVLRGHAGVEDETDNGRLWAFHGDFHALNWCVLGPGFRMTRPRARYLLVNVHGKTDNALPVPDGSFSSASIDFQPGELLGSVSGALGLRDYLERAGHELVVTADKDGVDSEFDPDCRPARACSLRDLGELPTMKRIIGN
jgi:hypothetical protein